MDINITNPVTANKIGSVVNGASSATPNDTDLVMSVDTSVAKKNTWTQIKAFLKTYFDGLYQAAGSYLTSANITQTITNGVTDKAPSEDAVYDALALKPEGDVCYYRKTGTTTIERWYTSAICAYNAVSSTVLPTNTLKAIPFIVPKTITLDRIAMEITGAGTAGSLVRLGIYGNSNNIPTTLILDAGTIAGDSATFQSITINTTLTAGLYWLVCVTNSAASITFRGIPVTAMPSILGVRNNLGAGNSATTIQSNFTYSTLPNPFDLTGASATAQNPGAISVRLSA